MSGSPKYSLAEIQRQRRMLLEQERNRRAIEETRLRKEAEERERKLRLEKIRRASIDELSQIADALNSAEEQMYPSDFARLSQQIQNLMADIRKSLDENNINKLSSQYSKITADMKTAEARRRHDDEEKKQKHELDKQKYMLSELKNKLEDVNIGDSSKFDANGRSKAEIVLTQVQPVIASGNPQSVRDLLNDAANLVNTHCETVIVKRAEWMSRKSSAETNANELMALIEGLKTDETVMRWRGASILEMNQKVEEIAKVITTEDFEASDEILKTAREMADKYVEEANAAQLKADERDYIVNSVRNTLTELGFEVGPITSEHPNHPATAVLFKAVNTQQEGVAVSVPFEGEVYYDVGGYSMHTEQRVDGAGQAKSCDKAQLMLEELHTALDTAYGVKMGEVMWEGKDPNRNIRKADQLPNSGNTADRRNQK